jgi:methyl-accepting chemotaxis protein
MSNKQLIIVGIGVVVAAAALVWWFRKRLSIKHKLTLLSLTIGLGSLAAIGVMSIQQSTKTLLEQEQQALDAIRASRQLQIEDYFGFIHKQMYTFSEDPLVTEASAALIEAFHKLPEQLKVSVEPGSEALQVVEGFYTQEFGPRVEKAGFKWNGTGFHVPALPEAKLAQMMYIAQNPNPVGSKLRLDASSLPCDYNRLHAHFHPIIRSYLENFEYYDVFLVDLDGNIVYTVFKEVDFSTNLIDGPYRDTNLGEVYRRAAASPKGTVVIEDYKPYLPSYGAPASFIAAPVYEGEEKIGVVAFQMPVGKINGIMNEHTGMGETGETYLVGADLLMRSDSRFSKESTIFKQEVDTETARAALAGESGYRTIDDYRGVPVVSSFSPLKIEGLKWAILAEKDLEEVTAPAMALRNKIVVAGFGVAVVVSGLALLFSIALIKPIQPIVGRAKQIAAGDLTGEPLPVKSEDELGHLTRSINEMSSALSTVVTEVNSSASEVAGASTEIAASSEQMARGMNEQSQQVTQISSAIEEMSASIVEVARKSVDAANNATESGKVAQEGGQVVSQTIEGMRAISEAVSASAASVAELGKRGEQIGQIIEVINDIADQTNLLALNAAIEAARAGEHGRGFAVVADEVRKLADRTTKATDEIAASIQAIQTETDEAVQRMHAGEEQVKVGVERATQAGQSLQKIVASAQEVAGMIQSIAAAAEQQSAASEQVARSVASIKEITNMAEQGARQSAAAVGSLAERATQLQAMLSRFKTSARSRGGTPNQAEKPQAA